MQVNKNKVNKICYVKTGDMFIETYNEMTIIFQLERLTLWITGLVTTKQRIELGGPPWFSV